MQPGAAAEIRLLVPADIPAAMALKEAAGWNQTEADWQRLLWLEPNGCFGAIKDGRLVGTTTTTIYDELAWIGMVLVAPQQRRQGIAAKLMNVALDYLGGKVETIKLDATRLGEPVYKRFGFAVESEVERWTGTAPVIRHHSQTMTVDDDAMRDLLRLDRLAFNADRSHLIEQLLNESFVSPALLKDADGTVAGYALARGGSRKSYVGPVVAKDLQVTETLLNEVLHRLRGREIYIDINKECIADTTLLSDRGFVKERDLMRMVRGGPSKKTSPLVVAIAGPELG